MHGQRTPPKSPATGGRIEDDGGILRRVAWLAATYGLLGGVAYGMWRGFGGAVVLTLSALAGIVNFRGLEAFSVLLEPQRQGTLGARNTLLITLRLVFLVGVVSAALVLGARHFLALILGFSVLPAALVTEAVIEACGISRDGKQHGG